MNNRTCECEVPSKNSSTPPRCRRCGGFVTVVDEDAVGEARFGSRSGAPTPHPAVIADRTRMEINDEVAEAKVFTENDIKRKLLRSMPCARFTVDEVMYLAGMRRDFLVDFTNTRTDLAGRESENLAEIERRLGLRSLDGVR